METRFSAMPVSWRAVCQSDRNRTSRRVRPRPQPRERRRGVKVWPIAIPNERVTVGENRTELRFRLLSNNAETITEGIAAKRNRRALSVLEFLLALPARVQHVDQDTLKIVDMEIDMNRCPVSLIPTHVVRSFRRLASCPLLNQADLAVPTFENDIRRDRSSDFGETQCTTIESQSFIELRDVNCNGVVHL